jgi:hypothetical protein
MPAAHVVNPGDPSQFDPAAFDGHASPDTPDLGPLIVVNPEEDEPTGWGPPNHQQYQSGHSQNVRTNQSAEQGMGVGPERQWAHYPHVEQPNPYRNINVLQRSGMDAYSPNVYRAEAVAYWALGLQVEGLSAGTRNRSPVAPVVNQVPNVPYVSTIPAFNAGYDDPTGLFSEP